MALADAILPRFQNEFFLSGSNNFHNFLEMWPAIMVAARTYGPVGEEISLFRQSAHELKIFASFSVVFPAALIIGFIGYNFETLVSDKSTPWRKSIIERREDRRAAEGADHFAVPETIFDRAKRNK